MEKENVSKVISYRRYDEGETIDITVIPIEEAVLSSSRVFVIDSGYMFLQEGIEDVYTKDNSVVSLKTINNIQSYYAKPRLTKDGVLTEAGKKKALLAGELLKTIRDREIPVVRITAETAAEVVTNPPAGRKLKMSKNEDNLIAVSSFLKYVQHHQVKILTNSQDLSRFATDQDAFAHDLERRGPNRKK